MLQFEEASHQPAPDTLLLRAHALAGSGRIAAAQPLVAAARRLGAPPDEADVVEAGLLLRGGRAGEALTLLDAAIGRSPRHAALREVRARARLLTDNPAGAALDAAEAVAARPADALSKATLGIAMGELGHFDDATACLAEAVLADPLNASFRLAYVHALERAGKAEAAAAVLDEGLALSPGAGTLWHAAAHRAIAAGAFAEAVERCRAARRAGVVDACLVGMEAHALSCLGDHAAAADAYEEALKLAPEDTYVRHLVAASGRRPPEPRAPLDYVRVVFEGYADSFDAHLLSLSYRVPGLLREAALAHLPLSGDTPLGPVIDLGCGTGLAGVAMSDLPLGPWHGVDLSPAMLKSAAARGIYRGLVQAALPEALAGGRLPEAAAVAVAADLCCYFGDLAPLLAAISASLRAGGWLLLSAESLDAGDAGDGGRGWRLRRSGRYAHGAAYVTDTAARAGLELVTLRREELRLEHGAAVPGFIAVLRRPVP